MMKTNGSLRRPPCRRPPPEGRPHALILADTLQAFFDGKNSNNNAELVDFLCRVRPMTKVRGNPAVIVSAHPVKSAGDDNLVPYGAGAILNEIDGNFTLARHGKRVELHWQGKLRGLDFHPLSFQIETVCTRDVLDSKGRQIPLPVMLPVAAQSDEDKEKAEKAVHETSRRLLLAMLD